MNEKCKREKEGCEGIIGRMIKTNEWLCTKHYYQAIRERSTE